VLEKSTREVEAGISAGDRDAVAGMSRRAGGRAALGGPSIRSCAGDNSRYIFGWTVQVHEDNSARDRFD
jgi:hypothetical protein